MYIHMLKDFIYECSLEDGELHALQVRTQNITLHFKSVDLYIKYMCKFKKYSSFFFFLIKCNLEVKSLHKENKKIIICFSLIIQQIQNSQKLHIFVQFFKSNVKYFPLFVYQDKIFITYGCQKGVRYVPKKKWIFNMQNS